MFTLIWALEEARRRERLAEATQPVAHDDVLDDIPTRDTVSSRKAALARRLTAVLALVAF